MTDQTNTQGTAAEPEEVSAAEPAAAGAAPEPDLAAEAVTAEAAAAEEPAPTEGGEPGQAAAPEGGAPDKAAAPEEGGEADKAAAPEEGGEADKAAASSLGGPGDQRSASSEADKAAEYLELARRTQADFDNYRKRMARENAAAADRGASRLAKELLPALDHLDLALKAASGHEDVVRGFAMVHGELIAALGRVGIQSFSPDGEAFDPSEHEAMAQRPVEGAESGTVVEVYQQGYRINGTVLRPARVVVAQ